MGKKIIHIISGVLFAFGILLAIGIAGGSDCNVLSLGQTFFGELIALVIIGIGYIGL